VPEGPPVAPPVPPMLPFIPVVVAPLDDDPVACGARSC